MKALAAALLLLVGLLLPGCAGMAPEGQAEGCTSGGRLEHSVRPGPSSFAAGGSVIRFGELAERWGAGHDDAPKPTAKEGQEHDEG